MTKEPSKAPNRLFYLLLMLPFLLSIIMAELGLRMTMAYELSAGTDPRSAFYAYHDTLGWFPVPGSGGTFTSGNSIAVQHNELGFRDRELQHAASGNIMVLGDSFVWGYNVEQDQRFTEVLDSLTPAHRVFNLGISGYGTDQEYLLMQKYIALVRPEITILIFCTDNDRLDNQANRRYRNYYKPFFELEADSLEPAGLPVPRGYQHALRSSTLLHYSYVARLVALRYFQRSDLFQAPAKDPTHALIAAMNKLALSRKSTFFVGIQEDDPDLVEFLKNAEIRYVVFNSSAIFPFDGGHWNLDGHREVARTLYQNLPELTDP